VNSAYQEFLARAGFARDEKGSFCAGGLFRLIEHLEHDRCLRQDRVAPKPFHLNRLICDQSARFFPQLNELQDVADVVVRVADQERCPLRRQEIEVHTHVGIVIVQDTSHFGSHLNRNAEHPLYFFVYRCGFRGFRSRPDVLVLLECPPDECQTRFEGLGIHLPFGEVVPGPQLQAIYTLRWRRPEQSPSFCPEDLTQATNCPVEEFFFIRGGIQ